MHTPNNQPLPRKIEKTKRVKNSQNFWRLRVKSSQIFLRPRAEISQVNSSSGIREKGREQKLLRNFGAPEQKSMRSFHTGLKSHFFVHEKTKKTAWKSDFQIPLTCTLKFLKKPSDSMPLGVPASL